MRIQKKTILPMALLSASLLFSAACDRDQPREEAADYGSETGTVESPGFQDTQDVPTQDDSRPASEATEIEGPAEDLVVDPEADQLAELDARERRVAERQAELEARERRLRQDREQQAARPAPRPAPRAEAPRPEREQVAERREPERAREPAPEPAEIEVEEVEEAPAEPAETRAEREEREERRLVTSVAVPDGTILNVRFAGSVSSSGSQVGDTFRTRVASDVIEGGQVVIPAGSEILGEVSEAVPLDRRIGGQARLTLRFTDLVLPSGTTVPIRASFLRQGRNETGRDAAVIGGGAAGGAVLGRILGGSKDRSRGTLVGAILGAAAGAVIASRTPGEEVVIPDGATVDLVLDEQIEVRIED